VNGIASESQVLVEISECPKSQEQAWTTYEETGSLSVLSALFLQGYSTPQARMSYRQKGLITSRTIKRLSVASFMALAESNLWVKSEYQTYYRHLAVSRLHDYIEAVQLPDPPKKQLLYREGTRIRVAKLSHIPAHVLCKVMPYFKGKSSIRTVLPLLGREQCLSAIEEAGPVFTRALTEYIPDLTREEWLSIVVSWSERGLCDLTSRVPGKDTWKALYSTGWQLIWVSGRLPTSYEVGLHKGESGTPWALGDAEYELLKDSPALSYKLLPAIRWRKDAGADPSYWEAMKSLTGHRFHALLDKVMPVDASAPVSSGTCVEIPETPEDIDPTKLDQYARHGHPAQLTRLLRHAWTSAQRVSSLPTLISRLPIDILPGLFANWHQYTSVGDTPKFLTLVLRRMVFEHMRSVSHPEVPTDVHKVWNFYVSGEGSHRVSRENLSLLFELLPKDDSARLLPSLDTPVHIWHIPWEPEQLSPLFQNPSWVCTYADMLIRKGSVSDVSSYLHGQSDSEKERSAFQSVVDLRNDLYKFDLSDYILKYPDIRIRDDRVMCLSNDDYGMYVTAHPVESIPPAIRHVLYLASTEEPDWLLIDSVLKRNYPYSLVDVRGPLDPKLFPTALKLLKNLDWGFASPYSEIVRTFTKVFSLLLEQALSDPHHDAVMVRTFATLMLRQMKHSCSRVSVQTSTLVYFLRLVLDLGIQEYYTYFCYMVDFVGVEVLETSEGIGMTSHEHRMLRAMYLSTHTRYGGAYVRKILETLTADDVPVLVDFLSQGQVGSSLQEVRLLGSAEHVPAVTTLLAHVSDDRFVDLLRMLMSAAFREKSTPLASAFLQSQVQERLSQDETGTVWEALRRYLKGKEFTLRRALYVDTFAPIVADSADSELIAYFSTSKRYRAYMKGAILSFKSRVPKDVRMYREWSLLSTPAAQLEYMKGLNSEDLYSLLSRAISQKIPLNAPIQQTFRVGTNVPTELSHLFRSIQKAVSTLSHADLLFRVYRTLSNEQVYQYLLNNPFEIFELAHVDDSISGTQLLKVPEDEAAQVLEHFEHSWKGSKRRMGYEVSGLYRVENSRYNNWAPTSDNVQGHLYHGTDMRAVALILQNHFRVMSRAKTGRAFGDGIYFSDCGSKAAQYISGRFGRDNSEGCLFICEADMGNLCDLSETPKRQYKKSWVRNGYHSCKWPKRGTVDSDPYYGGADAEYVVADVNRIRIKYLLHLHRKRTV